MIFIKMIGCIFIILSSSGIGYILGRSFYIRVKELKMMKISLASLENEIVYANTPLPDAFNNVSNKSTDTIKILFKTMSNNLKSKKFSTVGEAFESSINQVSSRSSLSKDDVEVLKSFGYSLGNSDVEGQIKSFKVIYNILDTQIMKAEELRNRNEKMYKNLGFLAGLAISIILL